MKANHLPLLFAFVSCSRGAKAFLVPHSHSSVKINNKAPILDLSSTDDGRGNALKTVNLLRGGSLHLTPADYTAAASAFFGGIRIPASLIAGASLGQLFALAKRDPKTRVEKTMTQVYNAAMLVAFMFTLVAVIVSTATTVSVLHGGFDPVATSGYELLKREFGLEFLTCRMSFLCGCLSFMIGVSNRLALEFDLLKEEKRDTLFAVGFGLIGVITGLASFVNRTIFCWKDIADMMRCWIVTMVERVLVRRTPLMIIAFSCNVLSAIFACKVLVKTVSEWKKSA